MCLSGLLAELPPLSLRDRSSNLTDGIRMFYMRYGQGRRVAKAITVGRSEFHCKHESSGIT